MTQIDTEYTLLIIPPSPESRAREEGPLTGRATILPRNPHSFLIVPLLVAQIATWILFTLSLLAEGTLNPKTPMITLSKNTAQILKFSAIAAYIPIGIARGTLQKINDLPGNEEPSTAMKIFCMANSLFLVGAGIGAAYGSAALIPLVL